MTPKRLAAIAGSVLILALLWQANKEPPDEISDKTEIEFWTMQLSPILDEYILSSIAEYEQQNPGITVKWVDVAWADMERKLLASVAAETAPDVANLNPQFHQNWRNSTHSKTQHLS